MIEKIEAGILIILGMVLIIFNKRYMIWQIEFLTKLIKIKNAQTDSSKVKLLDSQLFRLFWRGVSVFLGVAIILFALTLLSS